MVERGPRPASTSQADGATLGQLLEENLLHDIGFAVVACTQ